MLKFKITFFSYIKSMSSISFKIGFETKDIKLCGIPGNYRAKVKQENSAHNTLSDVTFFLLVFFLDLFIYTRYVICTRYVVLM